MITAKTVGKILMATLVVAAQVASFAGAPRMAFVNMVTGSHKDGNEDLTEQVLTKAAAKAGYVVVDKGDVVRAMQDLNLPPDMNFYTDSQGRTLLLKMGKRLGATYICANALNVEGGHVHRVLYKDGKATAKLQYLVVHVPSRTVKTEGVIDQREDKINVWGGVTSWFVVAGGGYLITVKTSKIEKKAVIQCLDKAYGPWMTPASVTSGQPIIAEK